MAQWAPESVVVLLLASVWFPGDCPGQDSARLGHRVVFTTTSLFGRLEVTEADGIRYLFVDGVPQTAMYPDPRLVARECHVFSKRYWLELLPYYYPEGKRCLLIGLGGGLLPAVLEGYGIKTHGVEIDPAVLDVAREYFRYRQTATVADGRAYLSQTTKQYDFVVIDAYGGAQFPYALASKECFRLVREHLTSSGVLALNLISRPASSPVSASVVRTLREVFSEVLVYRSESSNAVQPLACFAGRRPLRLSLPLHGRDLGVTRRQLESLAEYEVTSSSAKCYVLRDGANPIDREWSKEAAEWRWRMIALFGRGKSQ